jgi:hypothetical protein
VLAIRKLRNLSGNFLWKLYDLPFGVNMVSLLQLVSLLCKSISRILHLSKIFLLMTKNVLVTRIMHSLRMVFMSDENE